MIKPEPSVNEFTFRRNDNIGAAAAEDDAVYLAECFVDIGDLEVLRDCADSKRIIVGRTGAGKSALLATVASVSDHAVQLSPHSLSLNYIANNNVIGFFEEAGVNLSSFYILLWKHMFVVELLRAKYNIKTEDNQRNTMTRLRERLYKRDHNKELALDYLENWGNKFWLTTEERIHELTEKVEQSLSGSLKGSVLGAEVSAAGARKLSSEQRSEVIQRGQRAVSQVQIRELENIIQVLSEDVFTDSQENYYLTIDTLDEEWADDKIKYRLIKALIDTIRSFRRLENVKVIAALRQDLLDKVLHSTSDRGFQTEKYESLYLYIRWSKKELTTLLTKRVNYLIRRRYTSQPLSINEILPNNVDGESAIDYILDRTFLRPRDAILFLNECIALGEGRARLTATMIKQAEEEYSHKRLQSLAHEWHIIYPSLKLVAQLLYGQRASFPLNDLTREFLEDRYQVIASDVDFAQKDPNVELLNSLYTPQGNFNSVRNSLVRNLYGVGLVGIKTGPTSTTSWITDTRLSLSPGEVRPSASLYIHPMFYRALGIRL